MKTNEAPEKIWIDPATDLQKLSGHIGKNNVEYIRKDIFIKKLECWMNENFYQYAGEFCEGYLAPFDRTEDAIKDFINYIKEE